MSRIGNEYDEIVALRDDLLRLAHAVLDMATAINADPRISCQIDFRALVVPHLRTVIPDLLTREERRPAVSSTPVRRAP